MDEQSEWHPQRIASELMNPLTFAEMLDWVLRTNNEHAMAITKAIGKRFPFRPKWVGRQAVEKRIEWFSVVVRSNHTAEVERLLGDVLRDFHFEYRLDVMSSFLDCCSISHKEGSVDDPPPALDLGLVRRCTGNLMSVFDRGMVLTYLATAGWLKEAWRDVLWQVVNEERQSGSNYSTPAASPQRNHSEPETLASGNRLTVLDDLMVKALVASVSEVEGAFSVDHMADAVEELISLNADRHRSYFHRGFLNVLASVPLPDRFDAQNNAHVGWLRAGQLMAMARCESWPDLIAFYERNLAAFHQLLANRHPAAPMISPQIFEAFWQQGRHEDAIAALDPGVVNGSERDFLTRLLTLGEQLLLERHVAEARRVLDVLHEAAHPEAIKDSLFVARLERRRAQSSRAEGRFEYASAEFRDLLEQTRLDSRSELLSDLALCEGEFRWLSEICIPLNEGDVPSVVRRIAAGESAWQDAVAEKGGRTTNAEYALGVLALLRKKYEEATSRLRRAYSGALERSSTYQYGGLLDLIRDHYAISILLNMDISQFESARELLGSPRPHSNPLPRWKARPMLEAALQLGLAQSRATLVQVLVARNPELIDLCLKEDPEDLGEELTRWVSNKISERVRDRARIPQERWDDSRWLLTAHLQQGEIDAAEDDLERLENLAHEDSRLRSQLVDLLADPTNYHRAWSEEDASYVLARMYEEKGDFLQALAVLRERFFASAAQNPVDALGIFERITSYGLEASVYGDVERRASKLAESLVDTELGEQANDASINLAILFVGGNEQQKAYDIRVKQQLTTFYPRLTVEFMHTGWASNWDGYLDEVERKLSTIDALVIMRLIRTELGHSLRAAANAKRIPWVACTGRGQKSIILSIRKAVSLASGRLRPQSV